MIDLVFPTVAALLAYFVVIPAASWVVARVLDRLRATSLHIAELGSLGEWLLLIAPVIVPLVWVFCGGWHATSAHVVAACLTAHATADCAEGVILAALLLTPLAVVAVRRREGAPSRARETFAGIPLARRHGVRGLVCTRGILRPVIELDDCLAQHLTPDELDAVLRHEAAHARGRDPLLFWLLRLCLAINPARALLAEHAAGWELAREVRCDLRAVATGSDRFTLARALVRVAGATRNTSPYCNFVGALDKLDLRVRVLCADELPAQRLERTLPAVAILSLLLLAAHEVDHVVLDWLHHASEHLWLNFL